MKTQTSNQRSRNQSKRIAILKDHGIDVIGLSNGAIMVEDYDKLINVASWGIEQLYNWLGYDNYSYSSYWN